MVGHGGNIYAASRQTGIPEDKIVDFSASINPLGVPRSVRAEMIAHIGNLRHYPDPYAGGLCAEIGRSIGVDPDSIICGNGSTELIYLITRALQPKSVLVPSPTFSEYENAVNTCRGAWRGARSRVIHFPLLERNDFKLAADEFIKAMKGCDMAFICNPNNPTGGLVRKNDILRIADAANEIGCYLVLDEAFIDFIPGGSVVNKVKSNPHLIVLRSLTKFYALSGLRIGYAVFHPELIGRIMRLKEPWTVNTLAQIAGMTALGDSGYAAKTFAIIDKEKIYLEEGLRRIGIDFYPSCANFYLLRMDNAAGAVSFLRDKGILVRDCSNFVGLDNSYIRIAVRSRRENMRLLKELGKL